VSILQGQYLLKRTAKIGNKLNATNICYFFYKISKNRPKAPFTVYPLRFTPRILSAIDAGPFCPYQKTLPVSGKVFSFFQSLEAFSTYHYPVGCHPAGKSLMAYLFSRYLALSAASQYALFCHIPPEGIFP
jgi:hypothetical protein